MSAQTPLRPGRFYHVYNRGINGETLFREERNYRYFLNKYAHHVTPVADTYAHCLMPNHFHLLIRIRTRSAGSSSTTSAARQRWSGRTRTPRSKPRSSCIRRLRRRLARDRSQNETCQVSKT